jgi:hypothetical protein
MRYIIVAAACLVMTACVIPSSQMASFMGKDKEELHKKWGSPETIRPDGAGGQIWTYEVIDATQPRAKLRVFYIDKDGKIYKWSWRGL